MSHGHVTCDACGQEYDPKGTPHELSCEGSREDLLERVAELEARSCASCRFMAAPRDEGDAWEIANKLHAPEDDDGESIPTGHGTCVRIIHGNGGIGSRESNPLDRNPCTELATVVDGSGYAARLLVLPTFGCVLHQPKDSTT